MYYQNNIYNNNIMKNIRLENSNLCLNEIGQTHGGKYVFLFTQCDQNDQSQKFIIREKPNEIVIKPNERMYWDECKVPYGGRYDWRPRELNEMYDRSHCNCNRCRHS